MALPTLLLGLIIALLYGALYHLLRGGGFWRLVLFLGLSVLGFVLGHLVGSWSGWVFIPVGLLNLGMSSVGSLIILLVGDWLSRNDSKS